MIGNKIVSYRLYFAVFCLFANGNNILQATPILALKEANNCGACHKPGRSQKPFLWRRCTLDCQGCHIDPSGAGARNQWGSYYTHTSEGVAAYNFYEPSDPLQDTSTLDAHVDARMLYQRLADNTLRKFPMSLELTGRLRPFVRYLHLTYSALYLGRIGDHLFRMVNEGDRGYRVKYSAMLDELPLNSYIRVYRGTPMYGLRRPNHSLWIRERIGLDQFAVTDAVEVGVAPNVPYFHVSYMKGDPYAAADTRQEGMSYHAGLRGVTLGWHVNVSGWETKSKLAKVSMKALGLGANLWGVVLYAEDNKRVVDNQQEQFAETADPQYSVLRVHPSSQIREYNVVLTQIPGVMLGYVYETLEDKNFDSQRRSFYLDVHPIPFVQLEVWRRFESGTRSLVDSLLVAHLYADF